MPILGSCCGCLDLKVGTKIIGIINLIGAILTTLSMTGLLLMMMLVDVGVSASKSIHESHRSSLDPDDDYVDAHDHAQTMFELLQANITYVNIALYIMLGLAVLMIITSSMLIHGVRTDRRGLLLPFIVQEVVNIIVFIAIDIAVLVLFGAQEAIIGMVLSVVGGCLIQIYLLLVVISQYQALGLIRMHEEISMK